MDENIPNSQTSELDEDELNNLEAGSMPASTKRATEYGVRKFTDWIQKRGKICDLASIEPSDLSVLLRSYYAEVKANKQGTQLTPSTLTGLRAALHRYLAGAPYHAHSI